MYFNSFQFVAFFAVAFVWTTISSAALAVLSAGPVAPSIRAAAALNVPLVVVSAANAPTACRPSVTFLTNSAKSFGALVRGFHPLCSRLARSARNASYRNRSRATASLSPVLLTRSSI